MASIACINVLHNRTSVKVHYFFNRIQYCYFSPEYYEFAKISKESQKANPEYHLIGESISLFLCCNKCEPLRVKNCKYNPMIWHECFHWDEKDHCVTTTLLCLVSFPLWGRNEGVNFTKSLMLNLVVSIWFPIELAVQYCIDTWSVGAKLSPS